MTSAPALVADAPLGVQTDFFKELQAARAETDGLFRLIARENLYVRPLPQRHRLIFYVGHLEAFDWNQVATLGLGEPHLDGRFDRLFERGIDPEPGQLPADQPSDWPSIEETEEYVKAVRERLDALWHRAPSYFQQTAVEHRRMHAETLAYLLHNLPHGQKSRPGGAIKPARRPAIVDQRFVAIPKGIATLGRNRDTGFGWDNEFDEHAVTVPAFSISKYKATNGDYLRYVEAGHEPPHFWVRQERDWYYRGMFEMEPLPLDAPVYVTHEQAAAYAQWRGAQLPTESQFHRAAYGTPEGNEQAFPWGSDPGHAEVHGNFDCQHWDPVSVTEYPGGRSAFGVAQLVGNGWEWTSTAFGPFPGFMISDNYPGYSADFFDNKHFVIKGASPRTAAILTRRSLRNWFRPDYPYLYATFRLVENE